MTFLRQLSCCLPSHFDRDVGKSWRICEKVTRHAAKWHGQSPGQMLEKKWTTLGAFLFVYSSHCWPCHRWMKRHPTSGVKLGHRTAKMQGIRRVASFLCKSLVVSSVLLWSCLSHITQSGRFVSTTLLFLGKSPDLALQSHHPHHSQVGPLPGKLWSPWRQRSPHFQRPGRLGLPSHSCPRFSSRLLFTSRWYFTFTVGAIFFSVKASFDCLRNHPRNLANRVVWKNKGATNCAAAQIIRSSNYILRAFSFHGSCQDVLGIRTAKAQVSRSILVACVGPSEWFQSIFWFAMFWVKMTSCSFPYSLSRKKYLEVQAEAFFCCTAFISCNVCLSLPLSLSLSLSLPLSLSLCLWDSSHVSRSESGNAQLRDELEDWRIQAAVLRSRQSWCIYFIFEFDASTISKMAVVAHDLFLENITF